MKINQVVSLNYVQRKGTKKKVILVIITFFEKSLFEIMFSFREITYHRLLVLKSLRDLFSLIVYWSHFSNLRKFGLKTLKKQEELGNYKFMIICNEMLNKLVGKSSTKCDSYGYSLSLRI